jgi:hypothetical protein
MKKYLLLVIVFGLMLVGVHSLEAKEGGEKAGVGPLGGSPELREERQEAREEMVQKIQAAREEAKQKFEALREALKNEKDAAKAKIKELRLEVRGKFLERFDGAVARMEALEEKVDAAINNLDEKGVDTSEAQAFEDTAEEKLDEAKDKITEINVLLAKSIDQLTAEDKVSLRTLAKDTQTLLQEVHQALKDAVKSLRQAVQEKLGEDKDKDGDQDADENENENEND